MVWGKETAGPSTPSLLCNDFAQDDTSIFLHSICETALVFLWERRDAEFLALHSAQDDQCRRVQGCVGCQEAVEFIDAGDVL